MTADREHIPRAAALKMLWSTLLTITIWPLSNLLKPLHLHILLDLNTPTLTKLFTCCLDIPYPLRYCNVMSYWWGAPQISCRFQGTIRPAERRRRAAMQIPHILDTNCLYFYLQVSAAELFLYKPTATKTNFTHLEEEKYRILKIHTL